MSKHGLTPTELQKYSELAKEIRKTKVEPPKGDAVKARAIEGTVSTQTREEYIASEFEAAIDRLNRTLRTANLQLKMERQKRKEFERRMTAAGISTAYEPPAGWEDAE